MQTGMFILDADQSISAELVRPTGMRAEDHDTWLAMLRPTAGGDSVDRKVPTR